MCSIFFKCITAGWKTETETPKMFNQQRRSDRGVLFGAVVGHLKGSVDSLKWPNSGAPAPPHPENCSLFGKKKKNIPPLPPLAKICIWMYIYVYRMREDGNGMWVCVRLWLWFEVFHTDTPPPPTAYRPEPSSSSSSSSISTSDLEADSLCLHVTEPVMYSNWMLNLTIFTYATNWKRKGPLTHTDTQTQRENRTQDAQGLAEQIGRKAS